jgi:hypothetical protein
VTQHAGLGLGGQLPLTLVEMREQGLELRGQRRRNVLKEGHSTTSHPDPRTDVLIIEAP